MKTKQMAKGTVLSRVTHSSAVGIIWRRVRSFFLDFLDSTDFDIDLLVETLKVTS